MKEAKHTRDGNTLGGKTLRWTFEDGSMTGMTFEHHFYADGTVAYRTVDPSARSAGADEKPRKPEAEDRPKYKAFRIADDVVIASYLGESGYTLTVALNFADGRLAGFASNDKEWFPCQGAFEEAEDLTAKRAA